MQIFVKVRLSREHENAARKATLLRQRAAGAASKRRPMLIAIASPSRRDDLAHLALFFSPHLSHSTPNAHPTDPHGQDHHARGRVGTSMRERTVTEPKRKSDNDDTDGDNGRRRLPTKKKAFLSSSHLTTLLFPLPSSSNSQSDTIENVKSKIQDKEGTCLSARQRRKPGEKGRLLSPGRALPFDRKAAGDALPARSIARVGVGIIAPRWRHRHTLDPHFARPRVCMMLSNIHGRARLIRCDPRRAGSGPP